MLYNFGFECEAMNGSDQTENGGKWSGSLSAISRHFRQFPADRLITTTRSDETFDWAFQDLSNDVLIGIIRK
jgi:hypothetical protein